MKSIIVFALFLVACSFADLGEFNRFMLKYNKQYNTVDEYNLRFKNFQDNAVRAKEYSRTHPLATFGVTKFSDLSKEEFKAMYLPSDMTVQPEWEVAPLYSDRELAAANATWDWRAMGAVTPVKNQGQCGSCWSFSTTGNVEGQWFLAGNKLVGLSEQMLVDCDHHCFEYEGEQVCDAGCDGGLMPNAFMYIMQKNGIDTESSYPYTAVDGSCHFDSKNIGAHIKNWTYVARNESQMAVYMQQNGPLSIAVDAEAWQVYIGGVFQDPWCGNTLDHGVLIVGNSWEYNLIGEYTEYWIVKNSWGADWGEDGYIFLEKGSGECAINAFPCSATM